MIDEPPERFLMTPRQHREWAERARRHDRPDLALRTSWALFRLLLLPPALDRLRDLLVLFRHLREAVLPQAFRASPVPFWRLLAALLAIVLGGHRLPS